MLQAQDVFQDRVCMFQGNEICCSATGGGQPSAVTDQSRLSSVNYRRLILAFCTVCVILLDGHCFCFTETNIVRSPAPSRPAMKPSISVPEAGVDGGV